jgi:hypothetical protein
VRRRRWADRGVVGGSDGLLAGVLVALVGTLVIVNVWSVIAARTDADAAVREYLRVYTRADSAAAGSAEADAAARASLVASGRSDAAVSITRPDAAAFGPCGLAHVSLRLRAPLVRVPGLANLGWRTVTADGAEVIDPWRAMDRGPAWRSGGVACAG